MTWTNLLCLLGLDWVTKKEFVNVSISKLSNRITKYRLYSRKSFPLKLGFHQCLTGVICSVVIRVQRAKIYLRASSPSNFPSFKWASFFSPSVFCFVFANLTSPLSSLLLLYFEFSTVGHFVFIHLFSSFSFSPFYFSNPSSYYPFVLKVGHLDTPSYFPLNIQFCPSTWGGGVPRWRFWFKNKNNHVILSMYVKMHICNTVHRYDRKHSLWQYQLFFSGQPPPRNF